MANQISDVGNLAEILEQDNASLRDLSLQSNRIPADQVNVLEQAVARRNAKPGFAKLHLWVEPASPSALRKAPPASAWRINDFDLTCTGVQDLADVAERLKASPAVRILRLSENLICDVTPLAQALIVSETLQELRLGWNQISRIGLLAEALGENASLATLTLHNNQIQNLNPLTEALEKNRALTWLDVSVNQIPRDQIRKLRQAAQRRNIRLGFTLDLIVYGQNLSQAPP